MKVYTHFFPIGNEQFRWRTLLQFGNSWDIIGSTVMKNPGTSSPISKVDDSQITSQLLKFDNSKEDWFEFSVDSTMACVGDLFAFYYNKQSSKELNGVIQIFNLFYLKDGNLFNALKKDKASQCFFRFSCENDILQYDLNHLKMPIYLGFADLAFNKRYRNKAEKFFEESIKLGMNYCFKEFEKK